MFLKQINRSFKIGEALPHNKNILLSEYKVSEQTVTTAYKLLCNNQYAHKVGKTYWIGLAESHLQSGLVKYIYAYHRSGDSFKNLYTKNQLRRAFQRMEYELNRQNYQIIYESIDNFEKNLHNWLKNKHFPQGLIFAGLDKPTYDELGKILKQNRYQRLLSTMNILFTGQVPSHVIKKSHFVHEEHIKTLQHRLITNLINHHHYKRVVIFINRNRSKKKLCWFT